MKRRSYKQRVLALVTALLLLLGLVPFTAAAESMEAVLELDTPLTVSGTWEEPAYLFFTPEETAVYACWSSDNDLDPELYLYEADSVGSLGEPLEYYDDYMDYQFYMAEELTAGVTYCLAVDARDYAHAFTVTITKATPATALSFAEGEAATVPYGYFEEAWLTPVFEPMASIPEEIVWTSSDETVATIEEDGMFTIVGAGVTVIKATSENGLEATFELTVQEVEEIALDTDYTFETSVFAQYTVYTFTPAESAYYNVWLDYGWYGAVVIGTREGLVCNTSEKLSTVWLDADVTYLVEFGAMGEDTVTLRFEKTPVAEGIELGEDFSMQLTDWYWIEYELLPEGALETAVTFTSSDESVLTVDEGGNLYPMAPGVAVITATLENGASDTVTVTVKEPLVWDGVGTKHNILNPINREKVYRLTVEEDGWYAFTTDGSCNAELVLFVQGEDGIWDIGYAESENGEPLSLVVELFADEVYYVAIDADEELVAFDVTLQTCEEPDDADDPAVEQPEEGIVVLDTEIAATVGDTVFPDCRIAENEWLEEIRIADETVVMQNVDGTLIAVGVGTTTVTLVTDLGNTAEVTITVTAADVLTFGEPQTLVLGGGIDGQGFAFIPETDGTYAFYTKGDADTVVSLYDDEFGLFSYNDDTMAGYNAWLAEELTAGETYYVVFGAYGGQEAGAFTGAVGTPVPAASLEVVPDSDDYLFFEDGVYFVEKEKDIDIEVKFGPDDAVIPEEFLVEADDEDVVEVLGYNYVYTTETGAVTLTFTTENGLTATVKLQVIEPLLGDVNTDGTVDEADAALLLAHLQGKKDIGRRLYFAQMNDDEAVDMTDYVLLLKSIGETAFPGVGDVNGDDKTDSTDARLVLQYAVKKIPAEAISLALADVDGNGKVDSTDARLILQFAVKKITQFPVTK